MQVDLLVLLGILGGIGAVGTYAVGALRGIKKWVRATAASSEQAAEQLTTTGSVTVNWRLDEQDRIGAENRDRSIEAKALAQYAHERLDHHLTNEHGVHLTPNETKEN
jgi:hypothetical protein